MAVCANCKGKGYLEQYKNINGGQCFKCKGTGQIDDTRTTTQPTPVTASMVSAENQLLVFKAMTEIINAKGGQNKMCAQLDILNHLRKQGVETSRVIVEAALDVLIQHRYVRYFKSPRIRPDGSQRNYTYYGISRLGWQRWNNHINKTGSGTPANASVGF